MSDSLLSAATVRTRLAEACREAGSQRQWAARAGVSQAYLSSVLSGRREPGESILAALGLVRVVAYRAAI